MSHIGDILRKASHNTPPAMGFRPVAAAKPHMVLVAAINDTSGEAGAQTQGAEAVIISADIKPRALKSLVKTLSVPWGIWQGVPSPTGRESAGADFVIFEPGKAGLELMSNEDMGKIVAVEPSYDNTLLHGISELPVEAVYYIRAPQNTLSWLELMQCRRLSTLTTKPLLIPVSPDTPPAQLKTLWEAGVDGVVVVGTAENTLQEMRQGMDALALPIRRKGPRARPLVPLMATMPAAAQGDEDGEEEEEE